MCGHPCFDTLVQTKIEGTGPVSMIGPVLAMVHVNGIRIQVQAVACNLSPQKEGLCTWPDAICDAPFGQIDLF